MVSSVKGIHGKRLVYKGQFDASNHSEGLCILNVPKTLMAIGG